MSNFPMGVMKKNLKRETLNEVDNSPNIFNAKDFNIHDRELLSIQRYLVGDGLGQPNSGIAGQLAATINQFRAVANNGLMSQYAGSLTTGQSIPLPQNIIQTTTSGVNSAIATTINVASTVGFPSSGFITKFNNVSSTTTSNPLWRRFLFASQTSQEIISYTGTTATSFTGCTRSVEGTAQATLINEKAVIFGGKASVFIGLKSYVTIFDNNLAPAQFVVEHDSTLKVTGQILTDNGDPVTPLRTDQFIQIGYSLFIVGAFPNIQA